MQSAKALVRAAALAMTLALGVSGVASAASNTWYSLPTFHGSGSVEITRFSHGSVGTDATVAAKWHWSSGSYCVYVEYKFTASFALDGDWHRMSSDSCSTSTKSATYSVSASFLSYDGMKFRLCQNVPNATDPCGSSKDVWP